MSEHRDTPDPVDPALPTPGANRPDAAPDAPARRLRTAEKLGLVDDGTDSPDPPAWAKVVVLRRQGSSEVLASGGVPIGFSDDEAATVAALYPQARLQPVEAPAGPLLPPPADLLEGRAVLARPQG